MKTSRYILLLTPLVLYLLTGCKIGHRYQRPQMDIPPIYQSDSINILSEMAWWEVYTDTLLQSLIKQAILYNKDLLASEARVRQLAEQKRISMANLLPKIDGSAYIQKEGLDYGGNNYKNDPETGLKVSLAWEIDLWGNKRWARDESLALWLASVENQRDLMISVISDVATAYYELVALDYELSVVRNTLNSRAEGVRLAKLRFEGGLTSETSYQQAQVEYARTATHIPVLERNIDIIQNRIAFLIGGFPQTIQRTKSWDWALTTDSIPVSLSSTLMERRPDIRAAEQRLIAANAAVGVAYTNRFPTLSLVGIVGLESEELKDLLKSPMHFLSASLAGPILDMGKRQAKYRAEQYAYEAEAQEYQKVVIHAFQEVSDAITAFNKSKDIYNSEVLLRDAARSTVELAQLQYINGVISYLDLMDAQRSYFDAQIGYINAQRDKSLALIGLYKALGGSWQ